ncbi:MAG: amidohydrolase [Armatimonadetes bacterium]|nr:amidohydrolase [Armatimonadota bacterium]
MIIDVHAHIYPEIRGLVGAGPVIGLSYGRAKVGDKEIPVLPPLNEKVTHTPEMLITHMDWAGVDRAVLLQGSFYGECNDYVRSAVRRYPDRLTGAAYIDPWAQGRREKFEAIFSEPGFSAVKLECSEPCGFTGIYPDAKIDTSENAWLWDEMERRGLTLVLDLGDVGTRSYQTDDVRAIAERYPKLKIVIAHMAQPRPVIESDPAKWRLWERHIDLGLLPNVWFDTASVPAYVAEEGYPFPTAEKYLRMAIERIGASKIMWGTDIPGLLVFATYSQLRRLAELHTEFLPADQQALILAGNALQVFSWGLEVGS